jgi:hypothetical protein
MVRCVCLACFSFDFEFAGSDCTFEDENGHVAAPVLQLAFCYCMRVPGRHGLVKRLRVETRKAEIAQSLKQLYNAVDPRVVLKLLTHKICLACGAYSACALVNSGWCRLVVIVRSRAVISQRTRGLWRVQGSSAVGCCGSCSPIRAGRHQSRAAFKARRRRLCWAYRLARLSRQYLAMSLGCSSRLCSASRTRLRIGERM